MAHYKEPNPPSYNGVLSEDSPNSVGTSSEKDKETSSRSNRSRNPTLSGETAYGGVEGTDFRTLGRLDTALIFITNMVGLGVLSLPTALQNLGLIPGIIAIVGIGVSDWNFAKEIW